VTDVTRRNVKAGYLVKPDADETIAEAKRSKVGKRLDRLLTP